LTIIACLTALYAIGLPLEYVFGFVENMQALGLWVGYTVGLGVMLVFFVTVLLFTNWDKSIEEFKNRMKDEKQKLEESQAKY